jgi:hypothetical protein
MPKWTRAKPMIAMFLSRIIKLGFPPLLLFASSGCEKVASLPYSMNETVAKRESGDASAPDGTETIPPMPKSEMREFRGQDGRSIRARLVNLSKEQVTIAREDGVVFVSPITIYSPEDQAFIRQSKLDHIVRYSGYYREPGRFGPSPTNRDAVTILLLSKTATKESLQTVIAMDGTQIGCRTFRTHPDTMKSYKAMEKDIEEMQEVMGYGMLLDQPVKK